MKYKTIFLCFDINHTGNGNVDTCEGFGEWVFGEKEFVQQEQVSLVGLVNVDENEYFRQCNEEYILWIEDIFYDALDSRMLYL